MFTAEITGDTEMTKQLNRITETVIGVAIDISTTVISEVVRLYGRASD